VLLTTNLVIIVNTTIIRQRFSNTKETRINKYKPYHKLTHLMWLKFILIFPSKVRNVLHSLWFSLFTHFNTAQCLLTIANIRNAEFGEVPRLESVVWRHWCIGYDERIWKEFCCTLANRVLMKSTICGHTGMPKSCLMSLTQTFMGTVSPSSAFKQDHKP
jgi:hypothetical protein